MRELTMYCSARDQDVRVILTDEPVHDGQAPMLDTEVICLEIGHRCTGQMCPICASSPDADPIADTNAHGSIVSRKVLGHCTECGQVNELVLSSGGYYGCSVCGALRRWRVAH